MQANLSLTYSFPGWFAASWLQCNNVVGFSSILNQTVGIGKLIQGLECHLQHQQVLISVKSEGGFK